MTLINDPQRLSAQTNAAAAPPRECPACGAPIYKDPLDPLFTPAHPVKVYECGAQLIFHDSPPVRMEIKETCAYNIAFSAAVQLRAELAAEKEYSEQARIQCGVVLAKLEVSAQACADILSKDDALRAELQQARAERDNWRTAKAESDDVIKAIVSALGSAESGMDVVEYAAHVRAQLAAAPDALADAARELCDIASEYHAPMFSVLEPEYGALGLKLSDAIMKVRALLAAAAQTEQAEGEKK